MKFIAEMCQNHNGDPKILDRQIKEASAAGFTHAKIQGLYSTDLVKREQFEDPNGALFRPFEQEYARLSSLDLTEETESNFIQSCVDHGLTPMITVFTHGGLSRAERLGFRSVKIASYDCGSIPLIKNSLRFVDEIIVSTGATQWDEIINVARLLDKAKTNGVETALLHAKTIYPMPLNKANMAKLIPLSTLGHQIGWSDHSDTRSDGLMASKVAVLMGAKVIERHFTVLPKSETRDGKVSLNREEARELIDFCDLSREEQLDQLRGFGRDIFEIVGGDSFEPSSEELLNASYYRGRVASHVDGNPIFSWEEPGENF